jgi:hypothetical protein
VSEVLAVTRSEDSCGSRISPHEGIVLDWESPILACSQEHDLVMMHYLRAKSQPSATKICWVTVGKQRRRIPDRLQEHPA